MNPDDYEPTHIFGPDHPVDAMVNEVEQGMIIEFRKDSTPVAVMIDHTRYTALLDELAQYQGQAR